MADIVQKLGNKKRSAENAEKIAGHHKAGGDIGESGLGRLGAKQNDLKPVAGHDQQQAKK